MDIEMPIMDGYETTLALKKIRRLDNIPVIAFSGNTRQEDKDKSKAVGMLAHLSKPINVNNFYRTLLSFIAIKRSIQERLEDASEEFKALLGVGKFVEALKLIRILLQEIQNDDKNLPISKALQKIEENILRYEKVFLVLLQNYNKAFEKFIKIVAKLDVDETLSPQEKVILNLENAIDKHENIENYKILINDFCNTFRDSVTVLKERVKAFKFEEAIQLTFQIRREALALDLQFISNSIAPIVGIEKTQKRQLEESVEGFSQLVKEKTNPEE
jgi:CheY-like chemotaxis protein